jgi:hypothetical protein
VGVGRRGYRVVRVRASCDMDEIAYMEVERLGRRTSRRDKLEVMRHRRVVDEGVCDHVV